MALSPDRCGSGSTSASMLAFGMAGTTSALHSQVPVKHTASLLLSGELLSQHQVGRPLLAAAVTLEGPGGGGKKVAGRFQTGPGGGAGGSDSLISLTATREDLHASPAGSHLGFALPGSCPVIGRSRVSRSVGQVGLLASLAAAAASDVPPAPAATAAASASAGASTSSRLLHPTPGAFTAINLSNTPAVGAVSSIGGTGRRRSGGTGTVFSLPTTPEKDRALAVPPSGQPGTQVGNHANAPAAWGRLSMPLSLLGGGGVGGSFSSPAMQLVTTGAGSTSTRSLTRATGAELLRGPSGPLKGTQSAAPTAANAATADVKQLRLRRNHSSTQLHTAGLIDSPLTGREEGLIGRLHRERSSSDKGKGGEEGGGGGAGGAGGDGGGGGAAGRGMREEGRHWKARRLASGREGKDVGMATSEKPGGVLSGTGTVASKEGGSGGTASKEEGEEGGDMMEDVGGEEEEEKGGRDSGSDGEEGGSEAGRGRRMGERGGKVEGGVAGGRTKSENEKARRQRIK